MPPIAPLALLLLIAGCRSARGPALDLDDGTAALTIYQRETRTVPGSRGSLKLQIGDITHPGVLVSLLPPKGDPLLDRVEMRAHEAATFRVAGREYVLVLDRLVNLFAGADYATFAFVSSQARNAWEVEHLLSCIAASGHVWLRGEQELSSPLFADYLREKRAMFGGRSLTPDEFITRIASRSMTTGQPYRVRLPDGTVQETEPWLRAQLIRPAAH